MHSGLPDSMEVQGARAQERHGPLQPDENPTIFVRRFFADVMADLSSQAIERAEAYFHPAFTQFVDGDTIRREQFLKLMVAQKKRLATPPHFVWKNLVSTEASSSGRVHVTSVHSVSAVLRSGASMLQHVVALIEIDVASGTIIQCDELTRMEPSMAVATRKTLSPLETGSLDSGSAGAPAASAPSMPVRRTQLDRPKSAARRPKLARLQQPMPPESPSPMEPHSVADGVRLSGLPLTRTGVSDLIGGMAMACSSDGRALSVGDRTDVYSEFDESEDGDTWCS